jgi:hypothetical protein
VAAIPRRAACARRIAPTEADPACACAVVRTDADLACARADAGTAAAEELASDALVAEAECVVDPHPPRVIAAAGSASSAQPQPDRSRPGRARAAAGVTASGRFLSLRAWMTAT